MGVSALIWATNIGSKTTLISWRVICSLGPSSPGAEYSMQRSEPGTEPRRLAPWERHSWHGIDKDANAVSEAITRYSTPTISFSVDNCERLHTIRSPVDVVCSFETIEHLDDPMAFLAAVVRVLAPGGVFLCSTPDRSTTPPFVNGRPCNRYHRFEWYRDEFRSMLAEFFTTVELRSQVMTFSYARRLRAVRALQRWWLLRLAQRLPTRIGGFDLPMAVEALAIPTLEDVPVVPEPMAPLLGEKLSIVAICSGAKA